MSKSERVHETFVTCCLGFLLIWMFTGCASVKYEYASYYKEGGLKSEIKAKYFRTFNQKIGVGSISTELFEAGIETQEAETSGNIEAVGSAAGNIVGQIVTP